MAASVGSNDQKLARQCRVRWWILLALGVALGLHTTFWGQPVPARYALTRASSGNAREWTIARRTSPPETWRAGMRI